MMARGPSLSEDMEASYRVSLVRSGEGSEAVWHAGVDELPDLSARGATPDEAVRRVWAAANGQLQQRGTEDGVVTESDPKPVARHSGKLLVRMPATLHDELARAAESEGVSLNQLITGVLASAVHWRSSEEVALRSQEAVPAPGAQAGDDAPSSRLTRIALVANLAVVGVVAIIAIALLIVAWQGS